MHDDLRYLEHFFRCEIKGYPEGKRDVGDHSLGISQRLELVIGVVGTYKAEPDVEG